MGKPHNPRAVIYNTPSFPVATLLSAAERVLQWGSKHGLSKSKIREYEALAEFAFRHKREFDNRIESEPRLHYTIYEYVKWYCTSSAAISVFNMERRPAPLDDIVGYVIEQGYGTATGARGSLSRLVERGFLVRPRRGMYWPADVAYKEEDECREGVSDL